MSPPEPPRPDWDKPSATSDLPEKILTDLFFLVFVKMPDMVEIIMVQSARYDDLYHTIMFLWRRRALERGATAPPNIPLDCWIAPFAVPN